MLPQSFVAVSTMFLHKSERSGRYDIVREGSEALSRFEPLYRPHSVAFVWPSTDGQRTSGRIFTERPASDIRTDPCMRDLRKGFPEGWISTAQHPCLRGNLLETGYPRHKVGRIRNVPHSFACVIIVRVNADPANIPGGCEVSLSYCLRSNVDNDLGCKAIRFFVIDGLGNYLSPFTSFYLCYALPLPETKFLTIDDTLRPCASHPKPTPLATSTLPTRLCSFLVTQNITLKLPTVTNGIWLPPPMLPEFLPNFHPCPPWQAPCPFQRTLQCFVPK
jgi:hypothetical protein